MYIAKLAPSTQSPGLGVGANRSTAYSDSGYDSSSTSNRDSVAGSSSKGKGVSMKVGDIPLAMTAAKLFKLPDQVVQKEIEELSKHCTEKVCVCFGCFFVPLFFVRSLNLGFL